MKLDDLFPEAGRVLLTGGGKQFVERIGIEAIRSSILSVMLGENIRTQTEPISRRKIAIVSAALIVLFLRGYREIEDFRNQISNLAIEQINSKKKDKASTWIAQWIIGLTQKQFQNVLRSDSEGIEGYVADFEAAIAEAARKCHEDFGDLQMELGFFEDGEGRRVRLDWQDIARLTTAVGSQTLAIRGSDKSMYGKLFERLILGSLLTILGYERVDRDTIEKTEGVFWLSDSKGLRESDATLLIKPGHLIHFDIGFIGIGNPEISKDKLSRWGREAEMGGNRMAATTFIIVDRLPKTGKTEKLAERINAEIVQMSMQYWVKEVAGKLHERFGIKHEIEQLDNGKVRPYLEDRLSTIPVQDFLTGVSTEAIVEEVEKESDETCGEEEV
jgi:CfrBI restriction endonuclease